jgi:hypothetical protein
MAADADRWPSATVVDTDVAPAQVVERAATALAASLESARGVPRSSDPGSAVTR